MRAGGRRDANNLTLCATRPSCVPLLVETSADSPEAVRSPRFLHSVCDWLAARNPFDGVITKLVDADGASLEPDESVFDEAEIAARLLLNPRRTHEQTDSLVPFIRDQFYSIHKIDTRVCNQEVHRRPHAHPPAKVKSLQVGAFLWGTAILVQKLCFQSFGSVLFKWWKVGFFISLVQWAFYVARRRPRSSP